MDQAAVRFELVTSGEVTFSPDGTLLKDAGDAVFIEASDSAHLRNEGSIALVESGSAALISAGKEVRFENFGDILAGGAPVASASANGVTLVAADQGGRVEGTNGAANSGPARIEVSSTAATPFHVIGISAGQVDFNNEGKLLAAGEHGSGVVFDPFIELPTFTLINSGEISVTGGSNRGILVEARQVVPTVLGSGVEPGSPTYLVPDQRVVANEDSINVAGDGSAGMAFVATTSTRFENAGEIAVAGSDAVGIELGSASINNFLFNAGPVRVDGSNSRGLRVANDGNLLINGQDAVAIPDSALFAADGSYPADPVTVFSGLVEFSTGSGGTTVPVGSMTASGVGAVGVEIAGNGNLLINTLGLRDSNDAAMIEAGSLIRGTDFGVVVGGEGNRIYNAGTIEGGLSGLRGGNGDEFVFNFNTINGGLNLGSGNDGLLVQSGHTLTGVADGGADVDTLHVNAIASAPNEPASSPIVLDAAQYVNFERLLTGGDLDAITRMEGNWGTLLETRVEAGILQLMPGAAVGGRIELTADGILVGLGTADTVIVGPGAVLAPGASIGSIVILEDLVVDGGTVRLEAISPLDADRLQVGGSVSLQNARIEVLLGYLPEPEDPALSFFDVDGKSEVLGNLTILGRPAYGLDIPIGTTFQVDIGGNLVTARVVPLPAASISLASAAGALLWVMRRQPSRSRHPGRQRGDRQGEKTRRWRRRTDCGF